MNTQNLLIIGFLTLPLLSATAQRQSEKAAINVSGSAEVKVIPDEVGMEVGVETRHETLDEAKRQNDEHVARALAFLNQYGVQDKDVQTDYIAVEPIFEARDHNIDPATGLPLPGYDKQKEHKALVEPAFYVVRKSIGIRLTNLANFDGILTGLITNGINHFQRIDFRTSELRKHKDRARAIAIQAAKEKADAMASALGVKVGKPYTIDVNDWGGWSGWSSSSGWGYFGGGGGGFGGGAGSQSQNSQSAGGGRGEAGTAFAIGEITVSANVNVSFLIK